MANLFDRQKFKSELMARGIKMNNDEIDSYITSMNLDKVKPKSYLPYKQEALGQQTEGYEYLSMEDPYAPPAPKENAAIDFLGNTLWEFLDVGTFGIAGALDYNDWLENFMTTGGPGTFAGRVGAGIGGLAGFMVPMGAVKGAATMAIKGASKYGTKAAGKKMVEQGAKALSRTKYNKLSTSQQQSVWKPFTDGLNQYGRPLENLATKEKFMAKLNNEIRPTITRTLKEQGINPRPNTIGRIEEIVRTSMGAVEGSAMPIWNLQQRIAVRLGSSKGAGKIATIASHVIEEAAIFAAVEVPMELMNAVDEFRDPDIPGTMLHAVTLGSALGLIRFIPGGKDQPILRTGFNRLHKMFTGKRSYMSLDYGTEHARELLRKTSLSMYRADKRLFNVAVGSKGLQKLGVDSITSGSMINDLTKTQAGAEVLAGAMHQIEKNWVKRWWPEFMKESAKDMVGSLPRMTAGALAFNHSIVFDDHIPLEDKVFNVLVGAFMTKRGRQMDFIDANGKQTAWERTQRPWTYAGSDNPRSLESIDRYLRILGTDRPSLLFDSMLKESELKNKVLAIDETEDVKAIMKVMEKHKVIVSSEEKRTPKKKPQEAVDHELYDYVSAISGIYVHVNTGKRMLGVDELSLKQLKAIETDLGKLELSGKSGRSGLKTVADMQDIIYDANLEKTNQLIDLYKTVVKDMYAVLGADGAGSKLEFNDMTVANLDLTQLAEIKNPKATEAVEKVQEVRDLLKKHGIIKVAESTAPSESMKVELGTEVEDVMIKTMERLESDLHDLVYGSTPVHGEYAVQIGDEFLSNVINSNMIFKSVKDSHARLQALGAEGAGSQAWKITGRNDRAEIDELIGKIFANPDEIGALYERVVLSKDQYKELPGDYEVMQEFANTLLDILPYTSKWRSPSGFSGGNKQDAYYSDVKKLRNLFVNNGMGGFAFRGDDLFHYTNEFKGYAIDKKLSSAVRSDGKPFTGIDRAKVGALIQSGLVNEKMEVIDIVKQVDDLKMVIGNTEAWQKLADYQQTHSGKGLVLTNKLISELYDITDVKMVDMIKEQHKQFQELARVMNTTVPELVTNLHGKYMEHIDPYLARDGKGILEYRPNLQAEGDMLTMSELVNKLDLVDRGAMKESHRGLMDTIERYSTKKGITKEEQEFVTVLRNNFWNKAGDTAKIVSLLAQYGHTTEEGFMPLYNKETKQFSLDFKGAETQMKDALRDIERHIPVMARSELIEQKMRELTNEDLFASEVNNSITPQSFMAKYNLSIKDKNWFSIVMRSGEDQVNAFKKAGAHTIDKDNNKVFYDDMAPVDQLEFVDNVVRLGLTIGESRSIKRLTVGERAGIWADSDNTATDNPLFRFLDDTIGVGNYSIVGRKVEMGVGTRDSRVDGAAMHSLVNRLYDGGATMDVQGRADQGGIVMATDRMDGHIFIGLGDYSWGLAIPRSKASDLYNSFGEFIAKKQASYPDKYKTVFNRLNKLYNEKGTEEKVGDKAVKVFKSSDAEGDSGYMETMTTMMWMDKMAGELWWDHLAATTGKQTPLAAAAVAKWSKRIRLMSNVSARELSDEHVSRVISLHKQNKTLEDPTIADLVTLQKNKGLNVVLATDEGKGSEIFSTLRLYLKQINDENAAAGMTSRDRDNISSKEIKDGTKKREDASIADSVMLMPLKWFRALQTISGYNSMGKIGGMKPIVSSVGDVVLLGKTAIIPDTRFDGFFTANDKVHAIMMTSAAKITSSNIVPLNTRNMTMSDLKNGAIRQEDHIVNIPWKSINMGSAVSNDHPSTISYQITNEMTAEHSNSFYNWLIAGNVDKYQSAMGRFGNERNSFGAVAFARRLSDPGTGDNGALSVMDMWLNAPNGGGPVQFTGVFPSFKNSVKKRFLDNGMLQLHNEHGSQSVMSPFLGDSWSELRNTTYKGRGADRTLWTIGQAQIANQNRHKVVPLDRLNFVWHRKKNADELVSYDQIKNSLQFKRAIKAVTGSTKKLKDITLAPNSTLEIVSQVAREYSRLKRRQHEVAMVFHRTPSTRQSDKIIVGLKGFTKAEEGNQARLNPWDVYARAEADFDIDKINYWWDTPNDILKLWKGESGKTPFVSTEPNPSTLKNNYDWLDVNSMRKMSGDVAHAEKMRGQVVKAQRLVQFLSQYHSTVGEKGFKGFVLNLSGGWGTRVKDNDQRIVFDFDKMDENRHLLAEDIQRIIDSHNGYDADLYSNAWLDKFLFGDGGKRYNGLFKKKIYNSHHKVRDWDDVATEDIAGQPSLDAGERAIIKEVIAPYRSLLQLGTSIYEGGEAKSPRYDDLVTNMQRYDSFMGDLKNQVYNRLKYKYGSKKNAMYDASIMSRVNEIYGKMPGRELTDPFKDFGPNASTRLQAGQDTEGHRKLPFERMLATIAHGDKMSQDSPHSLWGSDLARFENLYNDLMGGESIGKAVQEVYSTMNTELKTDLEKLRFVNYLRWQEDTQRKAAANHLKDGHENMAARISENVAELVEKRMEINKSIENSPEILKTMTQVGANRIKRDILSNPRSHRQVGVPSFKDFNHAKNWINKNNGKLLKLASKFPIKYRAINSPEYRDALIFNEILSKYENIFIDPAIRGGREFDEFNNDLQGFERKRSEMWKQFFGDKKRQDKFNPWYNETRIMNALTNEFTGLFDKWNANQEGLGMLFLWKTMMPKPVRGEYTYFNGKLAPAFRDRDMSLVKFGLRFIANADESRISKFEKQRLFDLMTSQYTDWYDFLHSNKVTTKDGMNYREMYDHQNKGLYDNPSPLSDRIEFKKDPTQAAELNPLLHSMFGVDNTYSYGFVMRDPSTAGAMKDRTQFHVFPRGYIPIHYRGGEHPKISGWSDWNTARREEAYLMLGESLNKKILGYREQPIVKHTFNEVNAKPETLDDAFITIERKAQHEETSSNPDCK